MWQIDRREFYLGASISLYDRKVARGIIGIIGITSETEEKIMGQQLTSKVLLFLTGIQTIIIIIIITSNPNRRLVRFKSPRSTDTSTYNSTVS